MLPRGLRQLPEKRCNAPGFALNTAAVTETGIGTRPGDNLADVVFSFVFVRVLRQIRQAVDKTPRSSAGFEQQVYAMGA